MWLAANISEESLSARMLPFWLCDAFEFFFSFIFPAKSGYYYRENVQQFHGTIVTWM